MGIKARDPPAHHSQKALLSYTARRKKVLYISSQNPKRQHKDRAISQTHRPPHATTTIIPFYPMNNRMADIEEEEESPPSTPFWVKSTTKHRHSNRLASSIVFNTRVLLALLTISACVFLYFAIPSFVSYTRQVLRPNSVKKGWDSVNLLLVVAFAIVCAFLGRDLNNTNSPTRDDADRRQTQQQQEVLSVSPSSSFSDSRRWYGVGYGNDDLDNNGSSKNMMFGTNSENVARLRRTRTSSSYPDLRQEYGWARDDYDFRMMRYAYDDSYVNHDYYNKKQPAILTPRGSTVDRGVGSQRRTAAVEDDDHDEVKDIQVVDVSQDHRSRDQMAKLDSPAELKSPPTLEPSLAQQPPEPAATTMQDYYESTGKKKVIRDESGTNWRESESESQSRIRSRQIQVIAETEKQTTRTTRHVSLEPKSEHKSSNKRGRKREASTTTTKDNNNNIIFTSVYQQSKGKMKQKRKSHENLDDLFSEPILLYPRSPPPPPPPSKLFQSVFSSKKGKGKNVNSSPPPPSTRPNQATSTYRPTKSKIQIAQEGIGKAVQARTSIDFDPLGLGSGIGNESSLIPTPPPPPPPPPFKMKLWKFVKLKGTSYVKMVDNEDSPRSGDGGGDSELGEDEAVLSLSASSSDAKECSESPVAAIGRRNEVGGGALLFCPSPDVNLKADDFIARFRATLQLEKTDSFKQKQGVAVGLSPLGPSPSPTIVPT